MAILPRKYNAIFNLFKFFKQTQIFCWRFFSVPADTIITTTLEITESLGLLANNIITKLILLTFAEAANQKVTSFGWVKLFHSN